ncbi:MAG: AbrB/MazE/SpoVT family DNA-binding domain-containing protein [Burkholderiales bacterium]
MLTATLRNWGGSIALPLPKKLLASLGLQAGAEVSLDVSDGRLVIAPAPAFTFEQLLAEQKALKLDIDREWLDFPALPSEEA